MKTRRIECDSSLVNGIRYNPRTWDLDIRLGQKNYRYKAVTTAIFAVLICSESTGKAFNKWIKGKYKCVKLRRAAL